MIYVASNEKVKDAVNCGIEDLELQPTYRKLNLKEETEFWEIMTEYCKQKTENK